MKEKILFIAAMIGTFSATIILLINEALVVFGVDTSGYVDIINMVGIGLAFIILVVGVFFLNRYSTLQQKFTTDQTTTVNTALEGNAQIMSTLLPKLATDIMTAAEERGRALLQSTKDEVSTMMNEMLPELATKTMQIVTEQSQNIVNETTAKAVQVMKSMDELIPTYAKNISDAVAQTVRENNAHYHKMLTEIKLLIPTLPAANLPAANSPVPVTVNMPQLTIKDITALLNTNLAKVETLVLAKMQEFMVANLPAPIPVEEPAEVNTQSEEISEKSDEPATL